jgi:hypothetical protein
MKTLDQPVKKNNRDMKKVSSMQTFTVNISIPCRSRSAAARWYLLANALKEPEDRMSKTEIANTVKVTVQNVSEQIPKLRKMLEGIVFPA